MSAAAEIPACSCLGHLIQIKPPAEEGEKVRGEER